MSGKCFCAHGLTFIFIKTLCGGKASAGTQIG